MSVSCQQCRGNAQAHEERDGSVGRQHAFCGRVVTSAPCEDQHCHQRGCKNCIEGEDCNGAGQNSSKVECVLFIVLFACILVGCGMVRRVARLTSSIKE